MVCAISTESRKAGLMEKSLRSLDFPRNDASRRTSVNSLFSTFEFPHGVH